MADLFTKLGESIKTTVKEATEQTQQTASQTVLRKDLIEKKIELKKAYQQLGEAAYEAYTENKEVTASEHLYNRIAALLKETDEIEQQIEEIVNIQKDSFDMYKREVKKTWNENMAREPKPEPGEDGVEVMKICPKCNTGNHVEASFCINCGDKF